MTPTAKPTRDPQAKTEFATALMCKADRILGTYHKRGRITPMINRDLSDLASYMNGALFYSHSLDQTEPDSLLGVLAPWLNVQGAWEDGGDLRHPLAMLVDACYRAGGRLPVIGGAR